MKPAGGPLDWPLARSAARSIYSIRGGHFCRPFPFVVYYAFYLFCKI